MATEKKGAVWRDKRQEDEPLTRDQFFGLLRKIKKQPPTPNPPKRRPVAGG